MRWCSIESSVEKLQKKNATMASAACNHLSQRLIDSSLCPRGPAVTAQRHTLINTLHTIVPCKLEFSRKAVHLPTYACLQDIT